VITSNSIGIGTFAPLQPLHVQGNTYVAGCIGIGSTQPTHLLSIAPGTTTTAPILLRQGVNLTTPVSGAVEFDGSNMYLTPSAVIPVRGALMNSYVYRTTNAVTIANTTANQSIFNGNTAAASTGISLAANTTYNFETRFVFNSTGTTSHTEAVGFYYSGTTSSFNYEVTRSVQNIATSATIYTAAIGGSTLTANVNTLVMTPAITSIQNNVIYVMNGWVSTTLNGNWTPVITLSAPPGATSVSSNVSVIMTPYQSSSTGLGIINISNWA
jgi:hypothetical protein